MKYGIPVLFDLKTVNMGKIARKKKFALNNSYFKNKLPSRPDTILEIMDYQKEFGELPFEYQGTNRIYDTMCERQKRKSVVRSQFLTPDRTAEQIAYLAKKYDGDMVLDACCGTGQLTKYLIAEGLTVEGFDIDEEMESICRLQFPDHTFWQQDYKEPSNERKYRLIVSNPPYETKDLTEFFEYLYTTLSPEGVVVLLLPLGFLDKTRPANLVKVLNNFAILERGPMEEEFERTKAQAEIVVLRVIK